jgi:hypothetical protein
MDYRFQEKGCESGFRVVLDFQSTCAYGKTSDRSRKLYIREEQARFARKQTRPSFFNRW